MREVDALLSAVGVDSRVGGDEAVPMKTVLVLSVMLGAMLVLSSCANGLATADNSGIASRAPSQPGFAGGGGGSGGGGFSMQRREK